MDIIYGIDSGGNITDLTTQTGNVDIKFLRDTGNLPADETESEQIVADLSADQIQKTSGSGPSWEGTYVVHPAFKWGAENTEVSGIWVAKFEASHSDARIDESDNVLEGTSSTLKVVPNVTSWRNIDTMTIYKTCIDYDKNVLNNESLNSHMMKNIEWGAILFLSYSKYGLDGKEVGMNQCKDFVTGAGPGEDSDDIAFYDYFYKEKKDEFKSIYGYAGTQGMKASTTNNVYGVYDMTGGGREKMAAFVVGDDSILLDVLTENGVEDYTVDLYEGCPTNGDSVSGSKINYTLTRKKIWGWCLGMFGVLPKWTRGCEGSDAEEARELLFGDGAHL